MASRPKGFGLTAEVNSKIAGKYDTELAQQAMSWIQDVTGEDVGSITDSAEVHKALMDGTVLCKLMNAINPGSIKKVNNSQMAFKKMENINFFLTAADNYGCAKADMFQTVDLFEGANMVQVINGIHALGRKAQGKGYAGPTLGPRESAANKREFTDEQLKAGQGVIGLQMGSNKGASQAGQSFGKTRHIID